MRLAPIEHPSTIVGKLAYWMTERRFGKVITPMKVIYARLPALFRHAYQQIRIVEKEISLDPTINVLVRTWPAMINECAFCVDIAKAGALYRHLTLEKLETLPSYRTSPLYDARERAALAYVEEATRHKHVDDATFAELRRHFDERQIVEITWLNALENYYNLLNLPLGIEADGLCALAARRTA
ncbi:MAG: carboxymuconolactone decarboxylase family protein [Deltaproteobacteria bacterium]|nr:carboxymuconolactone decarboxylase family protein [Deltaproteobacteria bacterium]